MYSTVSRFLTTMIENLQDRLFVLRKVLIDHGNSWWQMCRRIRVPIQPNSSNTNRLSSQNIAFEGIANHHDIVGLESKSLKGNHEDFRVGL